MLAIANSKKFFNKSEAFGPKPGDSPQGLDLLSVGQGGPGQLGEVMTGVNQAQPELHPGVGVAVVRG